MNDPEILPVNLYKEPLKKVELGFGYYGVISGTEDGFLIQCHECGKLFANLGGHVRQKHKISANDYRKKYELSAKGLVSAVERKRLADYMLERIKIEGWDKKDFQGFAKEGYKVRKKFNNYPSLEVKNKRGTCPDQLLEKIREVKESIGHTPTKREFEVTLGTQKYTHIIYRTFGSYNKAIELLGLKPNPNSYSDEELLEYLRNFQGRFGRFPTRSEFGTESIPTMTPYRSHFGSVAKAKFLAIK